MPAFQHFCTGTYIPREIMILTGGKASLWVLYHFFTEAYAQRNVQKGAILFQ